MSSRKQRRNGEHVSTNRENNSNSTKKLVVMLIAVGLMIFSIFQVYYLAKYTLGHEISSNKLAVYRWVKLLADGDQTNVQESTDTTQK